MNNAERSLSLVLVYPATGQHVRMVGTPQEPEWVAKDVCDLLGILNSRTALARFADDEKGVNAIYTRGGTQTVQTVTEAGLYRLVFESRPKRRADDTDSSYAERVTSIDKFRRWVTHEVLPAIRKTGSYSAYTFSAPVGPELRLRTLVEARNTLLQGKLESRDELLLKDTARNLLADGLGVRPVAYQITITTRCEERGFLIDNTQAQRIGKVASKLYRKRYDRDPEQHAQWVAGSVRYVATYGPADLDLVDQAIDQILGVVVGALARVS